jgi:preprotein translocase subunit YajC
VGSAFAQTASGGGPPGLVNFAPLVFIAAIVYFLLIRPEQQKRKDLDRQIAGLKRNDVVVLSCGTYGRVVTLDDKTLGLEVASNVKIKVDRSAVQRVETAPGVEQREQKEREKS